MMYNTDGDLSKLPTTLSYIGIYEGMEIIFSIKYVCMIIILEYTYITSIAINHTISQVHNAQSINEFRESMSPLLAKTYRTLNR